MHEICRDHFSFPELLADFHGAFNVPSTIAELKQVPEAALLSASSRHSVITVLSADCLSTNEGIENSETDDLGDKDWTKEVQVL